MRIRYIYIYKQRNSKLEAEHRSITVQMQLLATTFLLLKKHTLRKKQVIECVLSNKEE